ncbi:hypothetical protein R1sor_023682 [Riccia sorocarpa]|uniref:Reverse transcriptase n=1 Tax=Riccia sorocarpa TaxID=122646 RepID=A0ABD3GSD5_9MARC
MRPDLMTRPGVLQAAEDTWRNHPHWVRDECKKWAMALGRIRALLMKERDNQNRDTEEVEVLQTQLQRILHERPTEDNKNEFETAKQAQENITVLRLEDGSTITEEEDIFKLVEENYSQLYTQDQKNDTTWANRQEALNLIDQRLTAAQNRVLRELPELELIEKTVRSLPRDKSPGLDGVVAEVLNLGCEVATPGTNFKYLGISSSCPVDEKQISAGIIKKIENRLAHWSNRLLSWPAKTILLRHVLAATPLYQLMSVGLDGEGLDGLERLCRQFMWGWNDLKNPKTSLVAWDRVTQQKQDGGLNWSRFRDKAAAMHIKCILRILKGEETEWAQLAKSLILRTLRDGSYQRERCQWRLEDALLMSNIQKIRGSPTLSRMLRSWCRGKKAVKVG